LPRIYRSQKEYERFLVIEFLRHLGYTISMPSWRESPDALLTLCKGKSKKRVAIEHTDYFNDTITGKRSLLTTCNEFWRLVQDSLVRRISQLSHLNGISARVRLERKLSKPENPTESARKLAKEIVAFTESHPVRLSEHCRWCSRDFDNGYPTMQSLLASLWLSRWTNDAVFASRCSWICCNVATGQIGFSLPYIKTAIENKNEKASGYDWGNADEKWLLIAASGHTVSNRAGPHTQDADWTDAGLMELCRNSPFDRMFFWERISHWYKSMEPDNPIVQYRKLHIE